MMILSVSRRTDIPAFYSEWFMNRIREGFVYVKNPFNTKQISKIDISPANIDCIVFWSKNPAPLMQYLNELSSRGYSYYFQFTLTGYNQKLETKLPNKETIIETFKKISSFLGKEKIIWRYDPVIITNDITIDQHEQVFDYIAQQLKSYTEKCIISFLDMYKKCERNMKSVPLKNITDEQQFNIAKRLKEIACSCNIALESCSEKIELSSIGIPHGKCIDDKLIKRITGNELLVKKDVNQRGECGCVSSVDIGAYNTCKHNCLYCYANFSYNTVAKNISDHDQSSPLLIGRIDGSEAITERKNNQVSKQLSLF